MMSDEQKAFLLAAQVAGLLALGWASWLPVLDERVTYGQTYPYAIMVWTIEFVVGYFVASAIGLVKEYQGPGPGGDQ